MVKLEKEYRISWLKVIGILILIVIIIAIICLVYPNNVSKADTVTSTYINNINLMKEAGFEYFQGSNLPEKIGSTNKITLSEMVSRNLLVEFKDENGNACNLTDSYVEATKKLDNEYDMKVFLSCDNKSDYIVTSITNNTVECTNCNDTDTTNNSNVVDNTSNASNTNKTNNNSSTVSSYRNNSSTVTYVTNYNINYVNSCCNGSNTNCSNNCKYNIYYTVSYNSNGGSTVRSETVKSGDTAPYKETTRSGYTFLGWYLNGELYDFNTPVTSKITLIAKWKKNNEDSKNEYNVNFESNGGTPVPSQKVDEGETVIKPGNPTRACYDFGGWYTNSSLTNAYDFSSPVYKNMTLYAKWIPNDSCKANYTVNFNSNGGSSVPSQIVLEGNTAYEPNDPTRACYDFAGWYTNSSLTQKYDFSTKVYANKTLYAKWIENDSCKAEYTVKFKSNGGTSVSTQYVYEGERAYEPKDPTRSGYTFEGWYTNSSLTKSYNFNNRVYSDITLYAKWEKEEEMMHTYCAIHTKTYYSTNHINANQSVWSKNWTIRFDDLRNVQNLEIINIGYITSDSMYNNVYKNSANKGISMVNGVGKYEVPINSASDLKKYSLKSTNFYKSLSDPYYRSGYWYTDASISIRNFNGVQSLYASNLGYSIHYVPFYFEVEYTDLNDCIEDKASLAYKYKDYEIIDTFYE